MTDRAAAAAAAEAAHRIQCNVFSMLHHFITALSSNFRNLGHAPFFTCDPPHGDIAIVCFAIVWSRCVVRFDLTAWQRSAPPFQQGYSFEGVPLNDDLFVNHIYEQRADQDE